MQLNRTHCMFRFQMSASPECDYRKATPRDKKLILKKLVEKLTDEIGNAVQTNLSLRKNADKKLKDIVSSCYTPLVEKAIEETNVSPQTLKRHLPMADFMYHSPIAKMSLPRASAKKIGRRSMLSQLEEEKLLAFMRFRQRQDWTMTQNEVRWKVSVIVHSHCTMTAFMTVLGRFFLIYRWLKS